MADQYTYKALKAVIGLQQEQNQILSGFDSNNTVSGAISSLVVGQVTSEKVSRISPTVLPNATNVQSALIELNNKKIYSNTIERSEFSILTGENVQNTLLELNTKINDKKLQSNKIIRNDTTILSSNNVQGALLELNEKSNLEIDSTQPDSKFITLNNNKIGLSGITTLLDQYLNTDLQNINKIIQSLLK